MWKLGGVSVTWGSSAGASHRNVAVSSAEVFVVGVSVSWADIALLYTLLRNLDPTCRKPSL